MLKPENGKAGGHPDKVAVKTFTNAAGNVSEFAAGYVLVEWPYLDSEESQSNSNI